MESKFQARMGDIGCPCIPASAVVVCRANQLFIWRVHLIKPGKRNQVGTWVCAWDGSRTVKETKRGIGSSRDRQLASPILRMDGERASILLPLSDRNDCRTQAV